MWRTQSLFQSYVEIDNVLSSHLLWSVGGLCSNGSDSDGSVLQIILCSSDMWLYLHIGSRGEFTILYLCVSSALLPCLAQKEHHKTFYKEIIVKEGNLQTELVPRFRLRHFQQNFWSATLITMKKNVRLQFILECKISLFVWLVRIGWRLRVAGQDNNASVQ